MSPALPRTAIRRLGEVEAKAHIEEDIVGEAEERVVIVDMHAMTCGAIEVKYNAINAKNTATSRRTAGLKIKA